MRSDEEIQAEQERHEAATDVDADFPTCEICGDELSDFEEDICDVCEECCEDMDDEDDEDDEEFTIDEEALDFEPEDE